MARLIEVQAAQMGQATLTVGSGDVLLLRGTGGRVRSGEDVVEFLGAFRSAVVGDNGAILAPLGPPNTLLFRARNPGRAMIDVVTGGPFHNPQTTGLSVIVEV